MKDALGEMQSVLVLGGTSDIALATVRKIVARRRARVVLAARKPEACQAAAAALRAAGASEVHSVAFDATDFASHAVKAVDNRAKPGQDALGRPALTEIILIVVPLFPREERGRRKAPLPTRRSRADHKLQRA